MQVDLQHAKTMIADAVVIEKDLSKRSHLLRAIEYLGELNFGAANHHLTVAGYEHLCVGE